MLGHFAHESSFHHFIDLWIDESTCGSWIIGHDHRSRSWSRKVAHSDDSGCVCILGWLAWRGLLGATALPPQWLTSLLVCVGIVYLLGVLLFVIG